MQRTDRGWSTGEGKGNPLQCSCLEISMNSMKSQNDRILKEELPRSVGANMLLEIGGEITTERMKGLSQSRKKYPVMDVTGDRRKVQCYKEQYSIRT